MTSLTSKSWFERHLNWTWAIVWLLASCLGNFGLAGSIGGIAIVLGITYWALAEKARSSWWILIPISVLFLKNKSTGLEVR